MKAITAHFYQSVLFRRTFRILIAVLALAGAAAPPTLAQDVRPLEDRFLFGVGTHQGLGGIAGFRGYVPATSINQLRELGATSFRDDLIWSEFELPGHRLGFTAPLSRLEAQINSDVATPLLILGYDHHLVENSNPPTTDEARRRFVEYAIGAVRSLADRNPIFELWNEWNLKTKEKADFNAANYLLLAQAVYPAVKQAVPNARLIVGAIGDDPGWRWTKEILRLGILKYADGISVHLYNFCLPARRRTALEVVDRLKAFHQLVDQANGAADFPIYVTEAGWPTAGGKCSVMEHAAADNTAQLILWASTASSWLKGLWLYELKDSGTSPSELEDNFGLFRFDNTPKPAGCSARDAWAFVRSSSQAVPTRLSRDAVMIKSTNAAGGRVAVWSEEPTRRYEVRPKADLPNATFKYPCDEAFRPAAGAWTAISGTPLLITAGSQDTPDFELRPAR